LDSCLAKVEREIKTREGIKKKEKRRRNEPDFQFDREPGRSRAELGRRNLSEKKIQDVFGVNREKGKNGQGRQEKGSPGREKSSEGKVVSIKVSVCVKIRKGGGRVKGEGVGQYKLGKRQRGYLGMWVGEKKQERQNGWAAHFVTSDMGTITGGAKGRSRRRNRGVRPNGGNQHLILSGNVENQKRKKPRVARPPRRSKLSCSKF